MSPESLIFYFLSAVLLISGLRVVTVRNPVHAALFLVLAFCTAAGLWLMLGAEFLAITLVLVYVGAVTVLFLFVVMTVDINIEEMRRGFWSHLPLAALVGGLIALEMILVLGREPTPAGVGEALVADSNTRALGLVLYTEYIYPFEIAAVLLLVAIIAAIALTLRKRKDTCYLDPAQQVSVRAVDRVRLVKMPAEQPVGPVATRGNGEE